MKGRSTLLMFAAVVLLALLPLWLVRRPEPGPDGQAQEIFGGADGQAQELVHQIRPDYTPWFTPVLEPASGEISSMLFALQAAAGAGFIGYYVGLRAGRTKGSPSPGGPS